MGNQHRQHGAAEFDDLSGGNSMVGGWSVAVQVYWRLLVFGGEAVPWSMIIPKPERVTSNEKHLGIWVGSTTWRRRADKDGYCMLSSRKHLHDMIPYVNVPNGSFFGESGYWVFWHGEEDHD